MKTRIGATRSWKRVHARPGAQPAFGAGVQTREQNRSPGTVPPAPSPRVCTQSAPLAQSASVAQIRLHMFPGMVGELEKFTQPRPGMQSLTPVQPLPSGRVPVVAQTRVAPFG